MGDRVSVLRPDPPRDVFASAGSSGSVYGGLFCQPNAHIFAGSATRCLCGARTHGVDPAPILAPAPTGWLCPRCGTANAPSVSRCSCPAPTAYASDTASGATSPEPEAGDA